LSGGAKLLTTGDLFAITGGSLTTPNGAVLVQVGAGGSGTLLSASDVVDVSAALTFGGSLLTVAANTTLTGAVLNATDATLTATNNPTLVRVTGATLTAAKLLALTSTTGSSSALDLGSARVASVTGRPPAPS